MGDVPKLNTTIQKTLDLAARCTQAETSDNYGILGGRDKSRGRTAPR